MSRLMTGWFGCTRWLSMVGVLAWIGTTSAQASINFDITQEHYRWRNDDGTETGATWKAPADTAITGLKHGENVRLRFCHLTKFYDKDTGSPTNGIIFCGYSLQYATSPTGPWVEVSSNDATTAAFVMSLTDGYTNGQPTAYLLQGSKTSWTGAGACAELSVPWPSVPGRHDTCMNVEYCFQSTTKATSGGVYYFRSFVDPTLAHADNTDKWNALVLATVTLANEAGVAPVIVSPLTATAAQGQPFSYTIRATGTEPITYGASGLPAGLSFSGTTIGGTPTAAGVFNVGLSARNAAGTTNTTLVLTVSAAAGEIVVDNRDANTSMSGSWSLSSGTSPWGADSYFGAQSATAENAWSTFKWLPNVLVAGNYQVYAWWTYHDRRSSAAMYRITNAGGVNQVTANQHDAALAGKWNLLGTYAFAVGVTTVELSAENGPTVCADAIKLVKVVGVLNQAPGAGLAVSTSMGAKPLTVQFDAGVSADMDGDALTYAWDFGDGTAGSGKTVSHQYGAAGRYEAKVSVSDGKGGTSAASATVRVQ